MNSSVKQLRVNLIQDSSSGSKPCKKVSTFLEESCFLDLSTCITSSPITSPEKAPMPLAAGPAPARRLPPVIFGCYWHRRTTEGAEFWITCKQLAFLSSFSRLQVIQNKHPWCSAAAYVTAGYYLRTYEKLRLLLNVLTEYGDMGYQVSKRDQKSS